MGKIALIDLFCGAGGVTTGFSRAKFNNDWGLFRMAQARFRSIYLPELTKVLELEL